MTVIHDFTRPAPDVIDAFRSQSPATLHEAMGKKGALPFPIKPLFPGMRVCGPAVTVSCGPSDNLMIHVAMALTKPGDVLVVDFKGMTEAGPWGDVLTASALQRGLAGLVIDGCVRDGALLEHIGFPVFTRGLCIRGTGKDYGAIGWIGAPLLIGDVAVRAGDLVAADGDGVCVLPRERAADVVERSRRREADEATILERLRAGESTMQVYGFR